MLLELSTVALVMRHGPETNSLKICLDLFNDDLLHERALLSVAVVHIDEEFAIQIGRYIKSLCK
jgi:hypothetical protein